MRIALVLLALAVGSCTCGEDEQPAPEAPPVEEVKPKVERPKGAFERDGTIRADQKHVFTAPVPINMRTVISSGLSSIMILSP